jgi:hypothetical protein
MMPRQITPFTVASVRWQQALGQRWPLSALLGSANNQRVTAQDAARSSTATEYGVIAARVDDE